MSQRSVFRLRALTAAATFIGLASCGDASRSSSLQANGDAEAAAVQDQVTATAPSGDEASVMFETNADMEYSRQKLDIRECGNAIRSEFSPFQIIKMHALGISSPEAAAEFMAEEAERCRYRLHAYAQTSEYLQLKREAAVELVRALQTVYSQDVERYAKWFIEAPFDRCANYEDCVHFITLAAGFAEAAPELLLDEARAEKWRAMFAQAAEVKAAEELLIYRFEVTQVNAYFYQSTGIPDPKNLGKTPDMAPEHREHLDEWISRLTREETWDEARERAGLPSEVDPSDFSTMTDPRNLWSKLINFRTIESEGTLVKYPGRPTLLKIKSQDVLRRLLKALIFDKSKLRTEVAFPFNFDAEVAQQNPMLLSDAEFLYGHLKTSFTHHELMMMAEFALQELHSIYRMHYNLLGMQIYLSRMGQKRPDAIFFVADQALKKGVYSEANAVEPLALWRALSRFHHIELRLPFRSAWMERLRNVSKALVEEKAAFQKRYKGQIEALMEYDPGDQRSPEWRQAEKPLDDYLQLVITGKFRFYAAMEKLYKSATEQRWRYDSVPTPDQVFGQQEDSPDPELHIPDLDELIVKKQVVEAAETDPETEAQIEQLSELDALAFMDVQGFLEVVETNFKAYNEAVSNFVERQKMQAFADESKKGGKSTEEKERWAALKFPDFHSLFYQEMQLERAMWLLMPYYQAMEHTKALYKKQELAKKVYEQIPEATEPYLHAMCYGYFLPFTVDKKFRQIGSLEDLKRYIAEKPAWQKIAESPFSAESFNLEHACGYRPERMKYNVANYQTKRRINEIYSNRNTEMMMLALQLPLISLSAEAAHFASTPVRKYFSQVGGKYILRESIENGLKRAVKKQIASRIYTPLEKFGVTFALRGISEKTSQGIALVLREGIAHLLAGVVGASAFTLTQHSVLATLGMKPWLAWDKDQSAMDNFWHNFGEEWLIGSAIFIVAPLVQMGVFHPIGRRIAGFSSAEAAHVHMAKLAQEAKGKFYLHRWDKGQTFVRNIRNNIDKETAIMASADIAGNTFVFGSIPFIDRAVRAYLYPDDHDPVLFEHEDSTSFFTERNNKEMVGAVHVAFWFYFTNAIKMDAARMRFTGSHWRRKGVFAFKLVTFNHDPTMWRSFKERTELESGELRDYYQDLGVNPQASAKEIDGAYKKIAKEHHPDRGRGNVEVFKAAAEAYHSLKDPIKRAQYDLLRLEQSHMLEYVDTVENAKFEGRLARVRKKLFSLRTFYNKVLSRDGTVQNPATAPAPVLRLEYHPN